MLKRTILSLLGILFLATGLTTGYSAFEDARFLMHYKLYLLDLDHAKVARSLVHKNNWAPVGTISTNSEVLGYPMVNVIAIDDTNSLGQSTGKIRFMLTDLDFTGPDWKSNNKVTVTLTEEENLSCRLKGEDPMEPTCARAMISGQVRVLDKDSTEYADAIVAFNKRHPASIHWMKAHTFYLCELDIKNIFVLDAYGGPHNVPPELYYKANLP